MRAKLAFPLFGLAMISLILSFCALTHVRNASLEFEKAGEPDFPLEVMSGEAEASPRMLGEMIWRASRGTLSESAVANIAGDIASKKGRDGKWRIEVIASYKDWSSKGASSRGPE